MRTRLGNRSLSLIQRGDINSPCKRAARARWAGSTFIGRKSKTISAKNGFKMSRDACEKKRKRDNKGRRKERKKGIFVKERRTTFLSDARLRKISVSLGGPRTLTIDRRYRFFRNFFSRGTEDDDRDGSLSSSEDHHPRLDPGCGSIGE